nr:hypothetical protein [Tanacetum cinerariifolium]
MGFPLMDPNEFEAPQSSEQAPSSSDYVPGLEYPEYVANSDPLEEDPEEDPADYPDDEGDDEEEESSEDDDDEEEEVSEKDEDEEEEEHLAPVDSAILHALDPVLSAKETKPFETNKYATTPPSPPQTIVPVSMTRLHRARISVRPHTPPLPSTKALIVKYDSVPTPPSLPPSPLSPLSSPLTRIPSPPLLLPPLHTSPTYASAPLGNRAAMVQLRAASPSTYHYIQSVLGYN